MTVDSAKISGKDREILRGLAARVREIAELPEMTARKTRLTRHNGLTPERPLVLCYPEGAWTELVPEASLQCTSLRGWEHNLRGRIYWWEHIRDDHVAEPFFDMAWHVKMGDYGVESPRQHGANRGSYTWDPPIKDFKADFGKLKFRSISVDRESTLQNMELATSLFGDLLPPRLMGSYWWSMGLTNDLINLIGLERLMMAMIDEPEDLHRLMAWMRDEHLNHITTLEREGVLLLNNRNGYTGSGGVAYTTELPQPDWKPGMPVRLIDLWGFAESQETVGVSPTMFGEFIFPYQLAILEKFGLNCYGCCEAVHQRLPWIMKIPRLRRVSVSPWADQRVMAEALGRSCIFSRKPNPAQICVSFNEESIRRDLRETLEIAGKGVLEIIMKDTHTVENQPWRITRWVELALDEVNRYMTKQG